MTSTPPPRDTATRKRDVIAALEKQGQYWLATAEVGGKPHLIGISGWWDGHDVVFTTLGTSKTARNLAMNPAAKLAGGTPADAVVIEAQVIDSVAVEDAADLAEGFKKAMGWDPREMEGWMFFRLRPTRIQAFRGYDEIEGRDVMVRSRWLA
jgi:pyridoxamine 5'-phosphate oxidase-like protein